MFAIVPIAVTLIGWYVSGDAVNILTKLSLISKKKKHKQQQQQQQQQQEQGSVIELSDLTKPSQEPTDVVVNMEAEPEPEKELGRQRKSEYPQIDHFRRAFHILAKQASVIGEVDGEPDGENIESVTKPEKF